MTLRWLARGMDDVPETAEWLSPAEAARLAGLRFPKRRTELRLSRWTAKIAVARVLGYEPLAGIEVRPAPDGAPTPFLASGPPVSGLTSTEAAREERAGGLRAQEGRHREQAHSPASGASQSNTGAPAPVSISLTDRADWAVCLVGPPGLAVGCDLELVEPRESVFVRDWFTPREQALVAAGEHDLLANVIWSAKESSLKVLRTGLRRATRSVEVDLDAAATGAQWSAFTARPVEGGVFAGWWRRYGDFVLTVATDGEHGLPREMDTPSRLATARPSHRWLTEN